MESTAITDPITQLRLVLTANATTSGLAGLTTLVAGERIDEWLGTGRPVWVRVVGAGLVVFGLAVITLSRSSERHLRRWVPVVSLADLAWVAASVATIVAGWYSTSGAVVIGVVAAIVGTFAVTQIRLLGRADVPFRSARDDQASMASRRA
jgi:hypothetical protein